MNTQSFTFESEGNLCNAQLFCKTADPTHLVIITGAIGMVQEQAPLQYALKLPEMGIACITFDHRYFGLSEGKPRQLEKPDDKKQDLIALANHVKSNAHQFPNKPIHLLGICKGGAYALAAAAESSLVDGFIGVSGFYFDDVSLEAESGYKAQRIAQGEAALNKYKDSGEVIYLPIVHETRQDAALPYPALFAWYSPWESKSNWVNEYAVMSDYYIYQYDSGPDARKMDKQALIIHANKSTNPGSAKQVYDQLSTANKEFIFYEEGVDFQTNFYDRDPLISRVCKDIKHWLQA